MTKQLKGKRQNGDKDHVLNSFLAKPEIFADLFNAVLYDGQRVIHPELL